MKTRTVWKKDHHFESFETSQTISLDGERKLGFNPKAMLLSSLAGCTGIDVVDVLEKMRVEFSSLEIEVETEQTEEHPKVFKDIHIRYRVGTDPGSRDKIVRAIELSLNKYCGVAAILRKNSEIHYTLEIDSGGDGKTERR